MQSTTVPALVIRRVLDAKPERVYQAWSDPQLAREFLCPEGVTIGDVAMDVRVGGAFHIVMNRPDSEPYVARGIYREVVPSRRLSMTWKWDEDTPEEEHETLLTLDFAPHGNGTELTLTHELLASEESRTNHEHGWSTVIDKMERL